MLWHVAELEVQGGSFEAADRARRALGRVYWLMMGGLLLTGCVALGLLETGLARRIAENGWALLGMSLTELLLVVAMSVHLTRMRPTTAAVAFWFHAVSVGVVLPPLCLWGLEVSIVPAVLVTSAAFGATAAFVALVPRRLGSWMSFLIMGLCGLLFASLFAQFAETEASHFFVSCLMVAIFTALAVYEAWQMRRLAEVGALRLEKLALYGALLFYLDFVNLPLVGLKFASTLRRDYSPDFFDLDFS